MSLTLKIRSLRCWKHLNNVIIPWSSILQFSSFLTTRSICSFWLCGYISQNTFYGLVTNILFPIFNVDICVRRKHFKSIVLNFRNFLRNTRTAISSYFMLFFHLCQSLLIASMKLFIKSFFIFEGDNSGTTRRGYFTLSTAYTCVDLSCKWFASQCLSFYILSHSANKPQQFAFL